MIHDLPLCFAGDGRVTHDPIFAAPCEHAECPSVVWHPLCLMAFRENRERRQQDLSRFLERHEITVIVREVDQ